MVRLNAPVNEMAARKMRFSRFGVNIQGDTLRGETWGEQIDAARHGPASEIRVASEEGRWVAQCVVDV